MDYSRITQLLAKFSGILKDSESKKETIDLILKKYIKINIPKENYKIEKDTLVFSVSPLIKNEVYMHKADILKAFEALGVRIRNIR